EQRSGAGDDVDVAEAPGVERHARRQQAGEAVVNGRGGDGPRAVDVAGGRVAAGGEVGGDAPVADRQRHAHGERATGAFGAAVVAGVAAVVHHVFKGVGALGDGGDRLPHERGRVV